MDEGLKQRLVGAAVLVFVAVVVIPIVLDEPREPEQGTALTNIPPESFASITSEVPALQDREAVKTEGGLREEVAEELRAFEPVINDAPRPAAPVESPEARLPEEAQDVGTEGASNPSEEPFVPRAAVREEQKETESVSGWVVQLASFKKSANADALQERLKAREYPVFLDAVVGKKGKITRVYVGPFSDQAEARAVAGRLRQETRLEGMVVAHGKP